MILPADRRSVRARIASSLVLIGIRLTVNIYGMAGMDLKGLQKEDALRTFNQMVKY